MRTLLTLLALTLPTTALAADADGDGFEDTVDCNDNDPTVFPGATEICDDGIDQDCDGIDDTCAGDPLPEDADGDGYEVGVDCDDDDASIHPGAQEICGDDLDNDCDGVSEDGFSQYPDNDGDGFGGDGLTVETCELEPGFVTVSGDCDDNDASIYPGAPETLDGVDNDCDGDIDEGAGIDADGDGYTDDVDCDDSDPTIHPGAVEVCDDTLDQNCDGLDNPMPGEPGSHCDPDEDGDGYAASEDCDDQDPSVNPGAEEICGDDLDNDCDGVSEDGFTQYADADGDGFGGDGLTVEVCELEPGFTTVSGDCDDNDPDIHPDAIEIPDNGIDEDCDGVDEEGEDVDADGDGVSPPEDCDDDDPSTFPGAEEVCGDGLDQDCDGEDLECDDDIKGGGCSSTGAGATFAAMLLPLFLRRR